MILHRSIHFDAIEHVAVYQDWQDEVDLHFVFYFCYYCEYSIRSLLSLVYYHNKNEWTSMIFNVYYLLNLLLLLTPWKVVHQQHRRASTNKFSSTDRWKLAYCAANQIAKYSFSNNEVYDIKENILLLNATQLYYDCALYHTLYYMLFV